MTPKITIGFLIIIVILSAEGDKTDLLSDLKIIAIKPKSEADNKFIADLGNKYQIGFWAPPTVRFTLIKGFIFESKAADFLKELKDKNLEYRLFDGREVVELIKKQLAPKPAGRAKTLEWDKDYYSLQDIYGELDRLAKESPNRVKVFNFGKTYEKFDMKAIKIFGNELKEKIVVLECGAHAREWISPAFCMWVVNKLMSDPKWLASYDFLIIPVFNADGYNWTWTVWKGTEDFMKAPVSVTVWGQKSVGYYRYWRKTRQNNEPIDAKYLTGTYKMTHSMFPDLCVGIDLNRNFPSKTFCAEPQSKNPCDGSETWCGGTPLSAPESKAYSEFLIPMKGKLFAYFSIHSHSQLFMYPYGYTTTEKAPNYSKLRQLTELAVAAIKKVDGRDFLLGSAPEIMYTASGATDDYVYENLGIHYVWTIEMRPKAQESFKDGDQSSGFVLPNEQMKPAIGEVWAGIEAILEPLRTESSESNEMMPAVEQGKQNNTGMNVVTPINQYITSIITISIICVFALFFKYF